MIQAIEHEAVRAFYAAKRIMLHMNRHKAFPKSEASNTRVGSWDITKLSKNDVAAY